MGTRRLVGAVRKGRVVPCCAQDAPAPGGAETDGVAAVVYESVVVVGAVSRRACATHARAAVHVSGI
jgi:hypothetical protein